MSAFETVPTIRESVDAGRIPDLWVGVSAVDGGNEPWSGCPVGMLYLYKPDESSTPLLYMKVAAGSVDADWQVIASQAHSTGFINVPLGTLREVVSNAITNIAANGGILASDTTPILNFTNGDTDSALRVQWAATNSDPVIFQTALPPDLNEAGALVVHFRAAMSGADDTPVISADTYFNEGDTKVEADSAAVTGTTYAEYTITVAAADVPAGAQTVSVELTPGAHATDALYITAVWLEYAHV